MTDREKVVSMIPHTTFRLGGSVAAVHIVSGVDELKETLQAVKERGEKFYILGGGSNTVFASSYWEGEVIIPRLKGVTFRDEGEVVLVEVAAGEEWDAFVAETVARGLHGLENLSYIPGSCGAAPVQNIGAYGAEVKDTIESVRVLDTETLEEKIFTKAECKFGYRDSRFKQNPGRYVIVSTEYRLLKEAPFNLSYPDLQTYFADISERDITLEKVREAVISIRKRKLPDVAEVGTAGSFFKNPIVSPDEFSELQNQYPEVPHFDTPEGMVKIPAGWLIEHVCGLKGAREGGVGVSETHALVLLNHGEGTAEELERLIEKIQNCIKTKTGLMIVPEVNVL